jgi:hypothetical protein
MALLKENEWLKPPPAPEIQTNNDGAKRLILSASFWFLAFWFQVSDSR